MKCTVFKYHAVVAIYILRHYMVQSFMEKPLYAKRTTTPTIYPLSIHDPHLEEQRASVERWEDDHLSLGHGVVEGEQDDAQGHRHVLRPRLDADGAAHLVCLGTRDREGRLHLTIHSLGHQDQKQHQTFAKNECLLIEPYTPHAPHGPPT